MLVVKIELHSAITGKITEIGSMKLWNTGAGTRRRGDYRAELLSGRCKAKLNPRGEVRDYPRLSYTAWELLRQMLNNMHENRER